MKKIVRFLLYLLTIAILIAYSLVYSTVDVCVCGKHNILPQLIMMAPGTALVGITLLLISKKAVKENGKKRIPYDFIAGILGLLISILCFVPAPKSSFFSMIINYDMSIIILFLGIYISLFIFLLYRRAKTLKDQKDGQNVQPRDRSTL